MNDPQMRVGAIVGDGSEVTNVYKAFEAGKRAALAAAPQVPSDPDTWSVYVAGMIGGYLGWGVDDERIQTVAGIIDRRRWAAPGAPQPAEPAPLTIPQVCDLVSDASLDWQKGWDGDPCEVNRFLKFARAIEAAHGIRATGVKEPGNA